MVFRENQGLTEKTANIDGKVTSLFKRNASNITGRQPTSPAKDFDYQPS
ncbi:MAG: hypothetical protein KTR28_04930 [Micavibrio sp.]|nr:hypothetical protein [Micavibrio sp.]